MAGAGHQATQATLPPNAQVRRQRPVRDSHRRSVPSSPPEASHWPLGSTAIERTCANMHYRLATADCEVGLLWQQAS